MQETAWIQTSAATEEAPGLWCGCSALSCSRRNPEGSQFLCAGVPEEPRVQASPLAEATNVEGHRGKVSTRGSLCPACLSGFH